MQIDFRLVELAARCTMYRFRFANHKRWADEAVLNGDWLAAAQHEIKYQLYEEILDDIESILRKESKMLTTTSQEI